MTSLRVALALFAAGFLLIGCDSSSSDTSPFKSSSWLGAYAENGTTLHKLEIQFGSDGNINAILVDDQDQSLTGTVHKEQKGIYGFDLADGTTGGFIEHKGHSIFVTNNYDFGVLEEDATVLGSPYGNTDMAGDYSGLYVDVNASFDIEDTQDSSVTIGTDGTMSGSIGNGTTFTSTMAMTPNDQNYGKYVAEVSASDGSTAQVDAILSPDKTFLATSACTPAGSCTFPADYVFFAWSE